MANLTETPTFDAGVYQLETTDPVLGGPSGIANAQAKALANRTQYLKQRIDAAGFSATGANAYTGNVNLAVESGWYYVTSAATNKPPGAIEGFLEVAKYTVNSSIIQIFYDMTRDLIFTRRIIDGPTVLSWTRYTTETEFLFEQSKFVGMVAPFARNTAPTGWLKCNGAAVQRTTYADLFASIGTTFGAGNGSTTFNLPDLRGEFIRGWDDGRGVDTGRVFGSAQLDQLQGHFHQLAYQNTGATPGALTTGLSTFATSNILANEARAIITDGTNGTPRVGAETRARNVALLYCIKF